MSLQRSVRQSLGQGQRPAAASGGGHSRRRRTEPRGWGRGQRKARPGRGPLASCRCCRWRRCRRPAGHRAGPIQPAPPRRAPRSWCGRGAWQPARGCSSHHCQLPLRVAVTVGPHRRLRIAGRRGSESGRSPRSAGPGSGRPAASRSAPARSPAASARPESRRRPQVHSSERPAHRCRRCRAG